MTKAEIVTEIANKTGLEKVAVQAMVEAFMETIKTSMVKGENIYLRGLGTFLLKKRAEKLGRIISKNTAIKIPAQVVPAFKPSKEFVNAVKSNVKLERLSFNFNEHLLQGFLILICLVISFIFGFSDPIMPIYKQGSMNIACILISKFMFLYYFCGEIFRQLIHLTPLGVV